MGVRNAAASAVSGDDVAEAIYVFGGNNVTYPLNGQFANQVYLPENDVWRSATPMPVDRAGLTAVNLNNTIFVVGGGHNIFMQDSTVCMQYVPLVNAELASFPALPLLLVVALVLAVVAFGVLVYFRKRKRMPENK